MNAPKVDELDYIQFLIAAQRVFTCTEAAACQPAQPEPPAHDAFTRLLASQPPDTEALWAEVAPLVEKGEGLLVLDDTTLDKPYARRMELVTYHWSGKHQKVVLGINLLTLLWTDGTEGGARLPVDCRVYDKPDALQEGRTKNAHFLAMLQTAKGRGFRPRYVCFDGWYSSLDNLKKVRSFGWHFLTRLKSNRLVNPEGEGSVAVADLDIPQEGRIVHLRGYGLIRVFRVVEDFDEAQHWATSDLEMTQPSERSWPSEPMPSRFTTAASSSAVASSGVKPAGRAHR